PPSATPPLARSIERDSEARTSTGLVLVVVFVPRPAPSSSGALLSDTSVRSSSVHFSMFGSPKPKPSPVVYAVLICTLRPLFHLAAVPTSIATPPSCDIWPRLLARPMPTDGR